MSEAMEPRFRFGDNWAAYSQTITETRIALAQEGLARLCGRKRLDDLSFLDIGCGSGLHALAALRLGAASVTALDLDPASARTAQALLEANARGGAWMVATRDVFDLKPETDGRFDIVYSWGVLHHTGQMWPAVRAAAEMVAPGGSLVIALYLKTRFCRAWTVEKRLYIKSPVLVQRCALALYNALRLLRVAAGGRNPIAYVREYERERGMSFSHDGHDWIGGYPYESATPEVVRDNVEALGFALDASFNTTPAVGMLGSGCAEYRFTRRRDA